MLMIFLPHTPKGTTYGSSLPKSAHYLQEWNISGKTGTHIDGITRHGYVTEDIFCMVELGSSGFTVVRYGTYGRFVLRFYSFEFQFWIFQECTNYRILVPIQLRFILFVLLKLAFSIFN
uniref:Uncharacterized protein n=1 Tax=Solanum lycopersicum TaxID=4081 RepID=A0A3Q7FBT9_SOLLC